MSDSPDVRSASSMEADRITHLSIVGMRCIDQIKLDLGAFTVLIGENGAGKSTIVEALELLRKVATESSFVDKLYEPHDGTRLVRSGTRRFRLGARIAGAGRPLFYEVRVQRDGPYLSIERESVFDDNNAVMIRTGVGSVSCIGLDGQPLCANVP